MIELAGKTENGTLWSRVPMIAICVATHNRLEYTQKFFASIAKHSYPYPLGFFVVDNDSKDGTKKWLENELKGDPKVIMHSPNDSLSRSWNLAMSTALRYGADLICLMNNDLMVGPGWLDPVVNRIVRYYNPTPEDVKALEEGKAKKEYWLPNGNFLEDDLETRVRNRQKTGMVYPGRCGWCMMFRSDTVRELLPIPNELKLWYGDDYIHWILAKKGYAPQVVDDCCMVHFGSKTLELRTDVDARVAEDRETYFRITGERL